MNYASLTVIANAINLTSIPGTDGPLAKAEASLYTLYTKNGVELAGWVKVVAYGQMAERFAQVQAEQPLMIEGPLTSFRYTTDAGTTSTYPLINLSRFTEIPAYFQFSMVTLEGRIGRNPEFASLESGSVVSNASIAVDGIKRDETHWFNLETWNRTAEVFNRYCRKGKQVSVAGSIKFDQWVKSATNEQAFGYRINVSQLNLGASPKAERNNIQPTASAPAVSPRSASPFALDGQAAPAVTPTQTETSVAMSQAEIDSIPF